GLVIIVVNTLSFELGIGHVWLGFLVMFIAFSLIFVAIKQYRDEVLGGVIRFATGFRVGLSISLVAGVVYVLAWELYLVMTDYAFIDVYIDSLIESRKASGATPQEIANTIAETDTLRQQYANPFFRLPMTFVEIFPVGVLISGVAALVLRDSRALAAN
ncbi:MAG: DUF4199 domain-containing protein, partial [Gammaproteobacteria bacterium]|nr:DUF4199 domain-containing protein [Gammaproteobacteria bacterium]